MGRKTLVLINPAVDFRSEWWQKETPTGWWHIRRLGRVDTDMKSVRSKGLSTLWTHTQMHRLGFNTLWLITKTIICPKPCTLAVLFNNLQRSPCLVSVVKFHLGWHWPNDLCRAGNITQASSLLFVFFLYLRNFVLDQGHQVNLCLSCHNCKKKKKKRCITTAVVQRKSFSQENSQFQE